jgi:hypothetical protein
MRSIQAILLAVLAATSLHAAAVLYPAPPGYPLSSRYQVMVDGRPNPVYDTRVFFELNNSNRVVSFSYFDFTGKAAVEVVASGPISSVRIRPSALAIPFQVEGRRVRFTLTRPAKLSVEINGGIDDNLHIFAGRPETAVPSPHDPNVLYYGPGIHYIDGEYGILHLKSHQTLYLAGGAVLRARLDAEDATGIRIRGRGILEGTTLLGREPDYYRKYLGEPDNLQRPNFVHFHNCRDIDMEGIILNDTPAWTVDFEACENVHVHDVKELGYVDNSDGFDVVSSRNVLIEDVFSRTNDDCVSVKSFGPDTEDVTVRDSVFWSDRAVGLQIGHETRSQNLHRIVFQNIDILEQRNRYIGHYALGVFAGDQGRVSDVLFRDIRVENCERLISLIVEKGFFNVSPQRGSIDHIRFENISSGTRADLHLYGSDAEHAVRDITFENLRVNGRPAEPELFANFHVHGLVFKQDGRETKTLAGIVRPGLRFLPVDITPVCNRSRVDNGDGQGWLDMGPQTDMRGLAGGEREFAGVKFLIPPDPQKGAIILRSSQHVVEQPYASYPIPIGRRVDHLFFLQGTAFTDTFVSKVPPEVWIGNAGKLRFNQSKVGTPLWYYRVRYADDGSEIAIPVQAGCNVEDWEIWAPGGWVVPLNGRKFYIQKWDNPHPSKPVAYVKVETALQPEVPIVLGVTMGVYEPPQ